MSGHTKWSEIKHKIEPDPRALTCCIECGRSYGLSHLGTCQIGSTMHGGSGIVGFRRAGA